MLCFKKKQVQIAEVRGDPLRDITLCLQLDQVQIKLSFHNLKMKWRAKKEFDGVQMTSNILEEAQKKRIQQRQDIENQIIDFAQQIQELEQKKIDQIRQISKMAQERDKIKVKVEEAKKQYLINEIKNEKIKKMILLEEQKLKSIICE